MNANGIVVEERGSAYNISVGGDYGHDIGHTCMLLNGSVECWGSNRGGQLGPTSVGSTHQGVSINFPEGRTVKRISAGGGSHACAVLDDDSVVCWGNGYYGQIGDATDLTAYTAKLIMCGKNQYKSTAGTTCTSCSNYGEGNYVNPAGLKQRVPRERRGRLHATPAFPTLPP